MIELTGKQRRHLRGLGQHLRPAVIIGKAGLSDAAVEQVSGMLDEHELVKVRLPAGPGKVRKETARALAESVDAACVGVVGRMTVLYRRSPDRPEADRIDLPDV